MTDEPQSSADSAHAKIANWLEDQARIATNGLHCGDNSTVIKHTYDWADKLEAAARHLRAEPRASAVSAQPEVWMWRATVGGVWGSWRLLDQPIDEFKKSAWGFNLGNGTAEVRALYARPERTEPQASADSAELEARLALADELMLPGGTHPYLGARKRDMIVAALRARAQPQAAPTARADLPPQHEIRELITSFEKPDDDTQRAFASHRRAWIVQCLRAESASVREVELEEALKNLMGIYDTPVSRRRYPQDQFMKEALDIARAALTRPDCKP